MNRTDEQIKEDIIREMNEETRGGMVAVAMSVVLVFLVALVLSWAVMTGISDHVGQRRVEQTGWRK